MILKRTIDIDVEALDHIVRDTIVDDYKSLCKENSILLNKKRLGLLTKGQLEDLEDTSKYVAAFETILSYYLTQQDKNEVVYDAWSGHVDIEEECICQPDCGCKNSVEDVKSNDESTRLDHLETRMNAIEDELDDLMRLRREYNRNVYL